MKNFMFALLVGALLSGFAPASAQSSAQEPAHKNLRITKYAKNINKPCPKGSDKMFIATVRVHRDSLGTFAEGNYGVGEIVLRSGRQLNAEDYQVPPDYRIAEYHFFAPTRRAKVVKDPAENSVTVDLSGPNMWFSKVRLRADCQERFGG